MDAIEGKSKEGRRLLTVVNEAPPGHEDRGRRWAVILLAALAVALYVASFFLPWWEFMLYAPQYPNGLHLTISLTGMGGDVREINMLNHYIGMASLDEAARYERELAAWGVGLLGVLVLAGALLLGRHKGWLLIAIGLAFPLGFLADAFFWMYHFGHSLDPRAPLRIDAFTPELFGNGSIGQFMTFATPAGGFWLAVTGVSLLFVAAWLRRQVCDGCADRDNCGAVCRGTLVGPRRAGGG